MSNTVAPLADTLDVKVLLGVLAQLKEGDFSARMPPEWTGVAGKVADGLNEVIVGQQALGAVLDVLAQAVSGHDIGYTAVIGFVLAAAILLKQKWEPPLAAPQKS